MDCPICGSKKFTILVKNEEKKIFKCKKCFSNFIDTEIKEEFYEKEYFKERYEKAYGKSYTEDEINIRNFSKRRLKIIKKLLQEKTNPKLLDIGSALGFFCDEAQKIGFKCFGVEISKEARNYAKNNFNIEFFQDINQINEKFDCITLWFTLEHIKNPVDFLKKVALLLKEKGILALSVPNGNGAFARFNPKSYILKRPEEHYFEPSIKGIKIMLKKLSFKIRKLEIFGLHPDRIGLKNCFLTRKLQKILKLGDTFEIYSQKKS